MAPLSAAAPLCWLGLLAAAVLSTASAALVEGFRPPAIPLLTTDPYMQTWMMGDTTTSDVVRHWDQVRRPLARCCCEQSAVPSWGPANNSSCAASLSVWTQTPKEMMGLLRVDGKSYRYLGACAAAPLPTPTTPGAAAMHPLHNICPGKGDVSNFATKSEAACNEACYGSATCTAYVRHPTQICCCFGATRNMRLLGDVWAIF